MVLIITVWIVLVMTSHQVQSDKVIIVNNDGLNSTRCCVEGKCHCSSLSFALSSIKSSTTINITSESVELYNHTVVGTTAPPLTSYVTITGDNKTVVKCNDSGSVVFTLFINITIRGITWDRCGNRNSSYVFGGIYFGNVTNLTIDNCKFQYSQMCAVILSGVAGDITITNSSFISNGLKQTVSSLEGDGGGLKIDSADVNTTIVISDSVFIGNGRSIDRLFIHPIYGLFIKMFNSNQPNLNLIISRTHFVSNFGGMYLTARANAFSTLILSGLNVSGNVDEGIKLSSLQITEGDINLMVLNSIFSNNGNGGLSGYIFAGSSVNITIEVSSFTNNRIVDLTKKALSIAVSTTSTLSVYVLYSNFVNNDNGAIDISTAQGKNVVHLVYFYQVFVKDCVTVGTYSGSGAVSISLQSTFNNTYYFQSVFFIANKYIRVTGGALFLKTANAENDITFNNCVFEGNSGSGQGAALHVADGVISSALLYQTIIKLNVATFSNNYADSSIVYVGGATINGTQISADTVSFINNTGTALYLFMTKLTFYGYALFENNFANSGAALYLEQGTQVCFDNKGGIVTVHFVNNTATQFGGALYTDLPSTCPNQGEMFHLLNGNLSISFINNTAGVIGNSMYFNIYELCEINTNVSSIDSLLYLPYKFNYNSEPRNTSIVTSPHSVALYFPNHDGIYIGNNTYFIGNKMLGKAITFTGAVFDYFNSTAEPTLFHVQCRHGCAGYTLANDRDWLLVDNVSLLSITLSGKRIDFSPVNITFALTSILASVNKQILLLLKIELSPCFAGYYYNMRSNMCVCYNHEDIVECYDDYNEIKRGYWFGAVTDSSIGKLTVSLCPSRYCDFGKNRKETRQGYCVLSPTLDDQCNSHRTGVACGECKPGYTLAYDSPSCINKDKCSAGMTFLVIVLTILYWVTIVAVVFVLMHFQFQISSGYAYGIIYYYSIVDILLDNNPYVSDSVFQVVAVLSSFAKLTPQLFGHLCLVKGLSGIDQQFIHYVHALAVSLILLIIVLVTRYSPRLALYVSRYIIRVICILLLLSYTSLTSTSLQLLQATQYPGYDDLYVYVSPDMKYFNNRHAFYGVVALLCGAIVVIGLPLFLLLEPLILSRWFNFVKIKPLLDQFQGCYKDNYRWFAAYYLICRQVIIVIVYFRNNDYYEMLYYLQTACVVIAMFHIWIQPYTDNFLNAFDGVLLLAIILVVNINTFTFLSSAASVIVIVLALLPLIVFCVTSSRKLILHCTNTQKQQLYNVIDDYDCIDEVNDHRDNTVDSINNENEDDDRDMTTFQESLLYQDYTN